MEKVELTKQLWVDLMFPKTLWYFTLPQEAKWNRIFHSKTKMFFQTFWKYSYEISLIFLLKLKKYKRLRNSTYVFWKSNFENLNVVVLDSMIFMVKKYSHWCWKKNKCLEIHYITWKSSCKMSNILMLDSKFF